MPRRLPGMLCLGLVLVGGCQRWRPTPLAPNVTSDLPANTRLVKPDGQTVDLKSGNVTADSVIGEQNGGQRIALARDSVKFAEVSSLSWPRTLGAVYAGLFVVGILLGGRF